MIYISVLVNEYHKATIDINWIILEAACHDACVTSTLSLNRFHATIKMELLLLTKLKNLKESTVSFNFTLTAIDREFINQFLFPSIDDVDTGISCSLKSFPINGKSVVP